MCLFTVPIILVLAYRRIRPIPSSDIRLQFAGIKIGFHLKFLLRVDVLTRKLARRLHLGEHHRVRIDLLFSHLRGWEYLREIWMVEVTRELIALEFRIVQSEEIQQHVEFIQLLIILESHIQLFSRMILGPMNLNNPIVFHVVIHCLQLLVWDPVTDIRIQILHTKYDMQ